MSAEFCYISDFAENQIQFTDWSKLSSFTHIACVVTVLTRLNNFKMVFVVLCNVVLIVNRFLTVHAGDWTAEFFEQFEQ